MTLDEAIIHAKDVAKSRCDECAEEHKLLAKWLEELQAYKQKYENRILERKTDDESMTIQEVIKRLKVSKGIVVAEVNNYDDKNIGGAFDIAMSALEYRIPKKLKHFHKEYPKHKWEKKDNGEIDTFSWDVGYCNGPKCERCNHMPCEHCNPDYDNEKCIVDKYYCPACGNEITEHDSSNGCRVCLQALDWSDAT